MPSADHRRFQTLDGARGVAAACVLVSHLVEMQLAPDIFGNDLGTVAVDVFFILSGFLITVLYIDLPCSGVEVARYAANRVGRVVPLFYALVIASFLAGGSIGVLHFFPIPTWGLFAQHLAFMTGVEALWTIPVEIRFYAIFVAIWLVASLSAPLRATLFAIVLAVIVLVVSRIAHFAMAEQLAYENLVFLSGALTAIVVPKHKARLAALLSGAPGAWLGWLALAVAVGLGVLPLVWGTVRASLAIDPIRAYIVFVAAFLELGPFGILSSRPLTRLGDISYGVYLFHGPLIHTVKAALPTPFTGSALALPMLVVVLTLVMATASRRWFERPVQRWFNLLGTTRQRPVQRDFA